MPSEPWRRCEVYSALDNLREFADSLEQDGQVEWAASLRVLIDETETACEDYMDGIHMEAMRVGT